MSFISDFNSVVGTGVDAFKSVWSAVNSPTKLTIGSSPAAAAGQTTAGGNGVGAALKQASARSDPATMTRNILLGAAAVVLAIGLVFVKVRR